MLIALWVRPKHQNGTSAKIAGFSVLTRYPERVTKLEEYDQIKLIL
jgi:hypothetical protein